MNCPRCERTAEFGQKFCNGCGLRLTGDDGSTLLRPTSAGGGTKSTATGDNNTTGNNTTGNNTTGADGTPTGTRRPSTPPVATSGHTGSVPSIRKSPNPSTTGTTPAAKPTANHNGATGVVGRPANPTSANPTISTTPGHRPIMSVTDPGVDPTSTLYAPANPTSDQPYVAPGAPSAPATAMVPTAHATTHTTAAATPHTTAVPVARQGPQSIWRRFHFSTTTVLGFVLGVLAAASIFVNILSVRTSPPVVLQDELPFAFRVGNWVLGQVGSNLPIAALIISGLCFLGAFTNGLGHRWGAGLVGGSALSMTGLGALVLGLIQMPIDGARQFATIETDTPFNVIITRDIGYYLLMVTAGLGVIAAFASLNECFADRQRDLNPWIAALGALSVVATVGGVMLPLGQAIFSDNWYIIPGLGEAPAVLVAARLVQLGLVLVTGTIGFLLVRPYGLGMAIGGTVPSIWLGFSVLVQPGDTIGPGWRNPGASDTDLHGLTIIGLAATASMILLACLSAYNQQVSRADAALAQASAGQQ